MTLGVHEGGNWDVLTQAIWIDEDKAQIIE